MTTFYDILGVAPTASADDIKTAYRHLAMQFHPDKTPGANRAVQRLIEDKFKEIQEACDTLKDRAKRAEYDAALAMLGSEEYYQPPPPPPPPPPQGQPSCPKCHKPFPTWATSTDKFCTYCGASLQSPPPPPKEQQQRRPQPPPPPPPPKQQQQQPQPLPPLPIGSRVGVALGIIYGWVVVIALLCGMFEQAHGVTGDIPTPDLCLATIYSTAFFFIIMCRSTHSGLRGWVRKKRAVLIGYLLLAIALTGITMAAIRQKSAPIVAQQQTSQVTRTKVQTPIQNTSPQRGNRSTEASKGRTVPAAGREPGCAVSEEDKKLGFVPDSCKSGRTWVKVVKGGPTEKQVDVDKSIAKFLERQTIINLGNALRDKGDFDGAIAKYRQALPLGPADGELHSDLGWAFEHKGDLDNATAEYNAALRINPLDNFSRAGLSRIKDKKAAQRQTSQASASQPPTAASLQPPKPASQPQMNVPLAGPTASQGVTHTPMAGTPQRFDSHHPSVGEPQGRERSELRPTTPSTVTANEARTDSRPSTTPRPELSRLSGPEQRSIEAACTTAYYQGPAAYNRCLEDQLSRLATAPRRPDLSRLSGPEQRSIEAACTTAYYQGPAAYNRCLVQQLDLIENHHR